MASRISSKQVTFRRPFLLIGFDSNQPAGTYQVNTEEELIEAPTFEARLHHHANHPTLNWLARWRVPPRRSASPYRLPLNRCEESRRAFELHSRPKRSVACRLRLRW
jgi:hypothetical protein